jgi:Zn-finger nucleic acid-binding protein
MTHGCCPSCRLRFTPAVAAHLDACPGCGEPPLWIDRAEELVGLRLVTPDDLMEPAPVAVADALPVPGLPGDRRGR